MKMKLENSKMLAKKECLKKNINNKITINDHITFCPSLLVLSLLLALSNTVGANDNICGPSESLFCNCDDVNNAFDATCFSLNNDLSPDAEIWRRFSKQPNIQRLKISAYNNFGLKHFPKMVFQTLKDSLHDVRLSDLNFTVLPRRAFHQMPKLQMLEISLCPTMKIEEQALDDLPRLEKIIMNSNNISILPKMFNALPMLRELFMEDNQIVTFEDDVFIPLYNLSYLTLDKNRIVKIESKNFNGLTNVNTLDIRANKIKHLPKNVFEKMPNLNILDLSNNQIEFIDEQAFHGLNKLQELKLEYNNIRFIGQQFRNLPNLVEVNLEFNNLKGMSKYSFYRPEQKRYVIFKIKNNTLMCNCDLFWLKEAFDSYADKSYEEHLTQKCYMSYSDFNNKTLKQFIRDPITEEHCTIPKSPTTTIDELETVPVDTIDSIVDELPDNSNIETKTTDGTTSTKDITNKIKEEILNEIHKTIETDDDDDDLDHNPDQSYEKIKDELGKVKENKSKQELNRAGILVDPASQQEAGSGVKSLFLSWSILIISLLLLLEI